MRLIRWEMAVLVLGALSMGAGCPLVPEIKDKTIELAVGGSTSAQFTASGVIDIYSDTKTINLQDLDLATIISDADIDASDVTDIKMTGISYRVTRTDPDPSRRIQGNVQVQRGIGALNPLVTNFDITVNNATSFQTATLDPAGVTVINAILTDLLAEIHGTPSSNTSITYHVDGTSTPIGVNSDFAWELKLDVTIKGKIKIKVVG